MNQAVYKMPAPGGIHRPPDFTRKCDIAVYPGDTSGCGWYRMMIPATMMQTTGTVPVVNVSPLFSYDAASLTSRGNKVTVVQRQVEPIQREHIEAQQKLGIKVIHDLDDYLWETPLYNPYRRAFNSQRRKALDWAIRNADVLTVSTLPLADAVRSRSRRDVVVIPNVLLPDIYRQPQSRPAGKKLRVGWSGSNSHDYDLSRITEVVKRTKDRVQWVFMGYVPPSLEKLVEFHQAVPVVHYAVALANLRLDVAVAPLAVNFFNECKSNLKLIEFGALGIPVITSSVYPYQDNPGIQIDNHAKEWKEWEKAIIAYDEDENLRFQHAVKTNMYAASFATIRHEHIQRIRHTWWEQFNF